MKRIKLLYLFIVACLFAVQAAHAEVFPAYVYTEANNTLYIVKHDDTTPTPTLWGGNPVTFFQRYTGTKEDAPYRSLFSATKAIIDPSLRDYVWPTVSYLFHGLEVREITGFENLNLSAPVSAEGMFSGIRNLSSLDLSRLNTSNMTNMNYMFADCHVRSLDLSTFNTSNVTSMEGMFRTATYLEHVDLSSFNTSNVTTMKEMFTTCFGLTSLDLSSFNTSKVTTMENMFYLCNAMLSLDLSSFNTSNVTNMAGMFTFCYAMESLNISSFNTSKVTTMKEMFAICNLLKAVDVSSFNTSQVTDMSGMFLECFALKVADVSRFNTENVTNMTGMFGWCHNLLTIDVSNFNTSKVSDFTYMFTECYRVKTLTFLNGWDAALATESANFTSAFDGTYNLEYLDLSKAKNMSVEHQEAIVASIPNRFTLKYLPEGSTVTGPNVITYDGTNFKSVEYVVSDDTLTRYVDSEFTPNDESRVDTHLKWEVNIPHSFTADKVTNTRTIGAKAGSAYTWFMPYSSPIPAGVEVYEFKEATVNGLTATFVRSADTELKAQKPYLVKSTAGEVSTSVDVTSEVLQYVPGNDVVAAEASNGWNFIGSFQWRTTEKAAEEGLHTLQTGNKWKHYEGSTAKPRPFRAYLKKAGSGARELGVNFEDGSGITGIEKIELLDGSTPENNSIYDLSGRYLGTRRDVLPTGTYIIGGKATRI